MQDVDHAAGAVDLDQVALANHPGRAGRARHRRQAVLTRDTCGVARDAAMRGLRAGLAEQESFQSPPEPDGEISRSVSVR